MSMYREMRASRRKYTGIPSYGARNRGMQASELEATGNKPVWRVLDREQEQDERVYGAIEISVEQMLALVCWGEAHGNDFALRLGEAFLRIIEGDQAADEGSPLTA